jgi:hypothetical protein
VKIFYPTGTRTPTPLVVQPVSSRYADWAIPAPIVDGRINILLPQTRQNILYLALKYNERYCLTKRFRNRTRDVSTFHVTGTKEYRKSKYC